MLWERACSRCRRRGATVKVRCKLTGPPRTYPAFQLDKNAGYVLAIPVRTTEYISIRCVTAFYGFRPYGGSLLSNSHKSTQKGLAPSYGLRCAQVPSLRSCSVGTPPRAIHGPSRLSRHPCRSTHYAEPPFGLPGGLANQKHCTRGGRPAGLFGVSNTVLTLITQARC